MLTVKHTRFTFLFVSILLIFIQFFYIIIPVSDDESQENIFANLSFDIENNKDDHFNDILGAKAMQFTTQIDGVLANLNNSNANDENEDSTRTNNERLKQLHSAILKWIESTQAMNDSNQSCPNILYKCVLNKCGFGCILRNELLMCAKRALKDGIMFDLINFENTFIGEKYGKWNSLFRALSNFNRFKCKNLTKYEINPSTLKMGNWIPSQFETDLKELHSDPSLLFDGFVMRYLLRLLPEPKKLFNQLLIDLKHKRESYPYLLPLIGVHIRRSDKYLEANLYPLTVYLKIIKYHLQNINSESDALILLATDDRTVVHNMMGYKIFTNPYSINISDVNNVRISQRKSHSNALISIVFDLLLLSESDFFVGQDSSNVAVVELQLMATRFNNIRARTVSVDCLFKDRSFMFPYIVSGKYV